MKTDFPRKHTHKGGYGPLFLVFCSLLASWLFAAVPAQALRGKPQKVKWVYDGDTFQLVNGDIVRLAGIDTPELGRKGRPDQYYAEEAWDALRGLVLKRRVIVKTVGKARDRFDRILAQVYLTDGRCVQDILLANGLAFCFFHNDLPEDMQQRFLDRQRTAMKKKAGFWNVLLSTRLASNAVVGNMNSLRFGQRHCSVLRKISERNKAFFENAYDAFFDGYSPYRKCGFWPSD
jgi:endonuclease YncB( thermonuclease family)